MPSDLSPAEQKQVKAIMDQAKKDQDVPHSTQDSIPFQSMFPDGVCRVTDSNHFCCVVCSNHNDFELCNNSVLTAINTN